MSGTLPNIYEDARAKELGAKTLQELGLPRYKSIKATVEEFLNNPDEYFVALKSALFFPSVMSIQNGIRYFEIGLNKTSTIEFIKNLLRNETISKDYLLTLSEYQENAFGGNITINPSVVEGNASTDNCGDIKIELVDGPHANLAYGDKSPVVCARNDAIGQLRSFNFDVLLKYSGLNENSYKKLNLITNNNYVDFIYLKEQIEKNGNASDKERLEYLQQLIYYMMKALNLIPKDEDNGSHFSVDGTTFHAGYYEFIVNPEGQIYFIDYRDPLHYSNLQNVNFAS